MNQNELNKLIEQLKAGNNAALKVLYESCSDYCIQKLKMETNATLEEAEDIFIEAIMNFREKLLGDKINHMISERAYIYKTCYNMYLVQIERQKRWNRKINDIEFLYYSTDYQSESGFDQNLLEATKKAWNQLSEKCKDIISHFYVDKIRMDEIANLMGLNSADVAKTTKARCYKKFKELAFESLKK